MFTALALLILLLLAFSLAIAFSAHIFNIERQSITMSFLVLVATSAGAYLYHILLTQSFHLNQHLSIRFLGGFSAILTTLSFIHKRRQANASMMTINHAIISGVLLGMMIIVFVNTPIEHFFANLKQNISAIFSTDSATDNSLDLQGSANDTQTTESESQAYSED
jgi:hypothetical protein